MRYELVEHTADIRLRVIGKTQEELFRAALRGMADVIKIGVEGKSFDYKKEIKIKSSDMTSLIVDFLSAVLTTSHLQKVVFYVVDFFYLSKTELHAIIRGIKVDHFNEDIKAVTYHEANIQKNSSGDWETVIVFDI